MFIRLNKHCLQEDLNFGFIDQVNYCNHALTERKNVAELIKRQKNEGVLGPKLAKEQVSFMTVRHTQ